MKKLLYLTLIIVTTTIACKKPKSECTDPTNPECPNYDYCQGEISTLPYFFEYYLDEELITPKISGQIIDGKCFYVPLVSVDYYQKIGSYLGEVSALSIQAFSVQDTTIRLLIYNPREGEYNYAHLTGFGKQNNQGGMELNLESLDSRFFITKLDTINNVVVGTFEIKGQYYSRYLFERDYNTIMNINITEGTIDAPFRNFPHPIY